MSTMNVAEWQAFRDLAGVPELKRLVSYFDKVQLRMLCVVQAFFLTVFKKLKAEKTQG